MNVTDDKSTLVQVMACGCHNVLSLTNEPKLDVWHCRINFLCLVNLLLQGINFSFMRDNHTRARHSDNFGALTRGRPDLDLTH